MMKLLPINSNQLYIWLILLFTPLHSFSQIPKKEIAIADSIVQTRMLCANTLTQLEDSIYYPKFKNQYQDRKTESYFFVYKVRISNDFVTDLNISINQDFSIDYISGMPDKNYIFSPCEMMDREKLWQIAKKEGLKTKYNKCIYYLEFEEEGIFIRFLERKSKFDIDHYSLNATTGKYISHTKLNGCF